MFSLEKLKVYDRALTSVAKLAHLSTNWDKRLQLCLRTGEIEARSGEHGVFLLDRVALLVRGLARMS